LLNDLWQFVPAIPATVSVPNVVGNTQAAATTAITAAGLVVGTVTTASSATVPAGSVISESPVAGTSVAQGSSVNLVVSSGPAQVAVPNVVGSTQAAATTAITGAGLVLGTVTTASSTTVAAGNVISESPVAGTQVNVGSAVNLVVSSGPAHVSVPNVVGNTQAAATTAITAAGLVVGTVTTASSATVPSGNVISESPVAGTSVAPGSSVNLVVSTGPSNGEWTWVNGAKVANQIGTYGTQGTPAPSNVPGGRYGAATWTDAAGNLWLFGGDGYDSTGTGGGLNDLWKYSAGQWTWMGGSNLANQSGTYGSQGTPAAGNVPGARNRAATWTDAAGNFWLFGGAGYDSAGGYGYLNDLWKFQP